MEENGKWKWIGEEGEKEQRGEPEQSGKRANGEREQREVKYEMKKPRGARGVLENSLLTSEVGSSAT